MAKRPLHITNGSVLTARLEELQFSGDMLTWQEMLCEGPTIETIDSPEFIKLRKGFFSKFYDIELNTAEIKKALKKMENPEKYSEINLWFEYDLFCHMNMIGVIALIQQKKIKLPIYLITSGRVRGSKNLKALTELTDNQLFSHFDKKVKLTPKDIDMVLSIWGIYCGKDHNLLKPFIVTNSTFKYLSNCLKAHLERFPNTFTGLNRLENNILTIIRDHTIKSRNHLLGYALNYQGYYGYGDLQMNRIIEKLSIFFNEKEDLISLNRKGHEALLGQHNFSEEINNNTPFGGVNKLDFQFNTHENKLVKTVS
ncbi:DUF1835 domain-containing protein [Gaetbulibacter aestuarii]|uniref:DUF1835 domain-containing protein n=1 Tax=Gaetbulibacter aestuarii TaxID=1502358 RepID=A0ABW7N0P1_9FLAO